MEKTNHNPVYVLQIINKKLILLDYLNNLNNLLMC